MIKKIKPMKWSRKDRSDFVKMQDRFNKKITRLESEGLETPSRLSIKDYKNITRRDFNILKKEVDSFTKRGSEQTVKYRGMELPKWKKENISRAVRSVAQTNKDKLDKLTFEKGNKTLKSKENILLPEEFKNTEKLIRYVEKNFKDESIIIANEIYKKNYLIAIKDNGRGGSELYRIIEKADATTIFNIAHDDPIFAIKYVYIASKTDSKWELLTNDWKRALNIIEGNKGVE